MGHMVIISMRLHHQLVGSFINPLKSTQILLTPNKQEASMVAMASFGKYDNAANQPPRPLLPHMLDQIACTDPHVIYGIWPVTPASYEAGVRTVTYAQLANVVNGLTKWLVENMGQGLGNEVLTYVGPNDVRIPALTIAAVKAGYSVSKAP